MVAMRTDPSDTGGLFVGRRPGTAPVHYRGVPERGTDARQRIDGSFATLLLVAMVLISVLCWGPIPIGCLWVGSEIDYISGSVFLGFIIAFLALFPMLFGALTILRRLDHAWILVRRAAGHDQRTGAMARIFGATAIVCGVAFAVWFLVIQGPGSQVIPGRARS
jgi:hypothetical protein